MSFGPSRFWIRMDLQIIVDSSVYLPVVECDHFHQLLLLSFAKIVFVDVEIRAEHFWISIPSSSLNVHHGTDQGRRS